MASGLVLATIKAVTGLASGDNTIISAPASGDIKILQLFLTSAGAVNVTLKNGASLSQSGVYVLPANGSQLFMPYTGVPWCLCDPGLNFVINLSGAVAVTGQVMYLIGG